MLVNFQPNLLQQMHCACMSDLLTKNFKTCIYRYAFKELQKQEAHVGHCRSPEYNERVKNLTSEWNQKQQSFIPHASRSLLCIRFVAVAFWAKKQFF